MDDAEVVFRAASRRILAVLGEDAMSLTDLAERLGVSKPAVVRALAPLRKLGVVESSPQRTPRGQETLYRRLPFSMAWTTTHGLSISWFSQGEIPLRNALLHQLPAGTGRDDVQAVLDEVRALEKVLSRAGRPLAWSVRFVIVFGSIARGEATWKSDVDLLFLLAGNVVETQAALERRLADAATRMTHRPSLHFATVEEFLHSDKSLHAAIREEGVVVRGDVDGPEVSVWRQLKRYASTSI